MNECDLYGNLTLNMFLFRECASVLLMLWSLPINGPINPNSFTTAVMQIKNAICAVSFASVDDDGKLVFKGVEGTGFLVGNEGYFITAAHVARAVSIAGPQIVGAIYIPHNGWPRGADEQRKFVGFRFQVSCVDEENDLALAKTIENPFVNSGTKSAVLPAKLIGDIPPDGTELAFAGFQVQSRTPIFAMGLLGAYTMINEGVERGAMLLMSASGWPGVSGSPLFRKDGRVIGVMVGRDDAKGLAGARPIKHVFALIDKARRGDCHE